ncbi:hypothetical protein FIBSPDRAFT_953840 [Athelia psychrophila]|uniref:PIG-F-domain-containing protein n=1 Tax=Athelia psychrophila TaxID=1759441 RepID=A0A166JYZ9_9AGAM|nr:hypothetical protein FIBSPDRAFT_953840 [Fibularhizoctonia sp. CBS 109695]
MPTRQTKSKGQAKATKPPVQVSPKRVQLPHTFFPWARYVSIVGVHTGLLVFVALFVPRVPSSVLPTSSPSPAKFLDPLTDDPKLTLALILAGLVALQGWWAGWVRQWSNEYAIDGTDTEKMLERNEQDKDKFTKVKNAWLATFAGSFAIHAIIVLFGAPVLSHSVHTYLLACILSLLTIFTPAYAIGIPTFASDSRSLVIRLTWTRLFAELSPNTPAERAIVYSTVGAAIGSWTGAFPIALDWERPWQAWPLTPAFGGIFGYMTGSLAAMVVSAVYSLAEEGVRSEQSDSEVTTEKKTQ